MWFSEKKNILVIGRKTNEESCIKCLNYRYKRTFLCTYIFVSTE